MTIETTTEFLGCFTMEKDDTIKHLHSRFPWLQDRELEIYDRTIPLGTWVYAKLTQKEKLYVELAKPV